MASVNASLVDEWLEDDNLMLLECWARDGFTQAEIADRIGIHPSTLISWKNNYPDIRRALSKGKEVIDYKVENALLKRALGYRTTEIKVTIGKQQKGGEWYMITKETIEREIIPDVNACFKWLHNRNHEKWKHNRDNTIEVGDDNNIKITILRGNEKEEDFKDTNKEITIETGKNKDREKEKTQYGDIDENSVDYWSENWREEYGIE